MNVPPESFETCVGIHWLKSVSSFLALTREDVSSLYTALSCGRPQRTYLCPLGERLSVVLMNRTVC